MALPDAFLLDPNILFPYRDPFLGSLALRIGRRRMDSYRTGRQIWSHVAHDIPLGITYTPARVNSILWNPTAPLLATAGGDGTLRLWDARTGRELVKAPLPGTRPIRFSRDGRILGPGHDADSQRHIAPRWFTVRSNALLGITSATRRPGWNYSTFSQTRRATTIFEGSLA